MAGIGRIQPAVEEKICGHRENPAAAEKRCQPQQAEREKGRMSFQELCQVPALAVYACALAVILGAVFGSFLNCMAWRMVHGESVLTGRSHCTACGHVLGAADLIPVISYLVLKGKCRYCGERVSPRYMVTELVSAGLWLLCLMQLGVTAQLVRGLFLTCILFVLSLVDLESYRIPNTLILALLIVYAVTFPFIEMGLPGTGTSQPDLGALLVTHLGGAFLLGGGMLLISLLFDRISGKEGLGGGDIKLFFAAGLYLGPMRGLLCVIVSCVFGLGIAAGRRNQKIPFGPAISAGILFCLYWGEPLVDWYLSLMY